MILCEHRTIKLNVFISLFSSNKTWTRLQRVSNSDRQSRRACWPLDHHRSWRPINLGSLHELSIQYVCWKLTIALRKIYSPLPFVEIVILTNMSDCHPLQVDLQYLNWLLEPMSQNKFENSYAMLHWNNPLWLVKTSHMTCSSQSECFIFT